MTSLDSTAEFNLTGHKDFVSTDAAALASHMNRCASERGRFFTLQAALESVHSMVCPRIVTVTAGVLLLAIVILASAT